MVSFIKKDLLIIKANVKAFLLILVFYVFLLTLGEGELDVSYFLPFIAIMLCLSTFSYDEFNNWNAYAITLPNGRKSVIQGKYVGTLILMFISSVLAFVTSLIFLTIKDMLVMEEIIASLVMTVAAMSLIVAVTYPLIFKFGIEKGRIGMMVAIFGIVGLMTIFEKIIGLDYLENIFNFLTDWYLLICPIFIVFSLFISYLISLKIYLKKEF